MRYSQFVFGANWPDLLWPLLFTALGLSLPYSLHAKLPTETMATRDWVDGWWRAIARILQHTALLLGLGFAIPALRLSEGKDPIQFVWAGGLVLALISIPRSLPLMYLTRALGWSLVLIGAMQLPNWRDLTPDPWLARAAILYPLGALLWIGCRNRPAAFVVATAITCAAWIGANYQGYLSGVLQTVWIDRFLDLRWLIYFPCVIGGIAAADCLVRAPAEPDPDYTAGALASLQAGIAIVLFFVGLWLREVGLTVGLMILLAGNTMLAARRSHIQSSIVGWGYGLLLIGLLLEPSGGGMRANPPNLSFALAAAGVSLLVFACLDYTVRVLDTRSGIRISDSLRSHLAKGNVDAAPPPRGFLSSVGEQAVLGYLVIGVASAYLLKLLPQWKAAQEWDETVVAIAITVAFGLALAAVRRLGIRCRL